MITTATGADGPLSDAGTALPTPPHRGGGVSPGAWNAIDLALCALFAAGSFYYYVAGVVDENRALSRSAALAFFVFFAGAGVFSVRVFL